MDDSGTSATARPSAALALMALLALPALAAAGTRPAARTSPVTLASLGVRAGHGYDFAIFCGAGEAPGLSYAKGGVYNGSAYTYSAKAGSCSAARRGAITADWPGVAKIRLRGVRVLRTLKGTTIRGCRGRAGVTREVLMTGTIEVTASRYFGKLRAHRLLVGISDGGSLNCSGKLPNTTELNTSFGNHLFATANRPRKGDGTAEFSDSFSIPNTIVSGFYGLEVTNKRVFEISHGTARIAHLSPGASGSLTATPQPACIGTTSPVVGVDLSGSVTVHSPVLGKLVFAATGATLGSYGPSDSAALPGGCNGIGSTPATLSFDNTCSTAGTCSIMYGTNADQFFDESNYGTQKVVSETINYGDGSAPQSVTPGQSPPPHTYAAAGNYTATISVETDNGQTQTATTPVDVGS